MQYGLDSVDSGSNYNFADKMLKPQNPRSVFDWSHLVTTTISNCGQLIPLMCEETMPGMDIDLSVQGLLRVMPSVVPLYSRQRLYIHGFYCRYSDLWNDALTYMKKGYTGNENLKKPVLTSDLLDPVDFPDGMATVIKPDSIFDYMGLPLGKKLSDLGEINALPFMALISIWKNYFMNKNLYMKNRAWLPNDDAEFRLNTQGKIISNQNATADDEKVYLHNVFYRDYPQDYFTSALPFPQRGDTPVLALNASASQFTFSGDGSQFTNFVVPQGYTDTHLLLTVPSDVDTRYTNTFLLYGDSGAVKARQNLSAGGYSNYSGNILSYLVPKNPSGFTAPLVSTLSVDDFASHLTASGSVSSVGFTLDQFRELAIAQSELERMARTDGSFLEFSLTFFGIASRNAVEYRPTYIGGTYQNIMFSEVLQTSNTSDQQSPLGSYAGHGITSLNGQIGHCTSDEHGYILLIASVMPDIYYSQGLSKKWTRLTQDEEFLPGRDKMGLIPVLNRELYVSGVADTDSDLFAYQTPFDDFRYKPNRICGKIADTTNLSFAPYTQARVFGSTPTYSKEFFRADKVRKDYLAAPSEDAYTAQFQIGCRVVAPLSYLGTPAPII